MELDNNDDPKLDQLYYFKCLRTELIKHGVYNERIIIIKDRQNH